MRHSWSRAREVCGRQPFAPIPVAELDLSRPTPTPDPNPAGQIHLLVRIHDIPLGSLTWYSGDDVGRNVRTSALEQVGPRLLSHLYADGQLAPDPGATRPPGGGAWPCAPRPSDELLSVIICTLGEDPRLAQTVDSVLGQTHTNLELIVVDNNPTSKRVPGMLAEHSDPRLRIIVEHRRGLSVARNTGLAAARGAIVAFTDDDALADPGWLRALAAPFENHPDVACVTGLVLPAQLNSMPQVWFEEFGAFDKGYERVVWSARHSQNQVRQLGPLGDGGPLFPYSCGVFGSGNNMAFRARSIRANGGFDVALGAGTRSHGGEDLDAFLTTILHGAIIVYEPAALIRHYARSDLAALRKQMFGYGSGMCAVIVKHVSASPSSALRVAVRLPAGLRKLFDPGSAKNEDKGRDFPRELTRTERRGYLMGPWLYLRSRRDARRHGLRPAHWTTVAQPGG